MSPSNTAKLVAQLELFDEITQQNVFKETVLGYFKLYGKIDQGNGANDGYPISDLNSASHHSPLKYDQVESILLYVIAAQRLAAIYELPPLYKKTLDSIISQVEDLIKGRITSQCFDDSSINVVWDECKTGSTYPELNLTVTNPVTNPNVGQIPRTVVSEAVQPNKICISYYTNVLWYKYIAQRYQDTFSLEYRELIDAMEKPIDLLLSGTTQGGTNCSVDSYHSRTGLEGKSIRLDGKTSWSETGHDFDERRLREIISQANLGTEVETDVGESLLSLSRAFQRLEQYDDIHKYLQAYISHKYNTLIESITSTDPYYNNWNNSDSSYMDMKRRLSISYTLLAGIAMPEIPQAHKTPAGAIVGGSVGAVFLISILIWAYLLYNRRRHDIQPESRMENSGLDPFTLQLSDKQLVTTSNAPRDWQLKDRSGRSWIEAEAATRAEDVVAPRSRRYSSPATLMPVQEPILSVANTPGEERDLDSGWRPGVRLPPRYEDAM
ncbi:hypothetical protein VNI00_017021 [Paramarasmius palmivorus]|uniref:Uncharacterized protein n=1 Tax=Paramarasmius palmivorus TaxID=297713 RepID=A0AAW0B9X6_9AGAR